MTVFISDRSHIRINVGGKIFVLEWSAVRKFPGSRLEQLCRAINDDEILALCDEYDTETGECFFDRHPKSFENIWNLVQSGKIYLDADLCAEHVFTDLQYWGVSINHLPLCCRYNYEKKMELIEEEYEKVRHIMKRLETVKVKSKTKFGKFRNKLWNIMEHPETSIAARITAVTSIFFIVISTVSLILHTYLDSIKSNNSSVGQNNSEEKPLKISQQGTNFDHIFDTVEYVCIIWFTLEYVLRLVSTSQPLQFFKKFLNVIDFIAIAPFYVTLLVANVNKLHDKLDEISKLVQIFRILRVLRVLKLARHSDGLQSLGYTLQKSYKELGLLVGFIAMGVFLFSSLVYFAEKEAESTKFHSIPHTFWLAIISMTTVGYGDMCPSTTLGQIFASICCVTGVLVISLPIPIIVSNFAEFYKNKIRIEKTLKKREELEKAKRLGSFIILSNFAQNTLGVVQPFLKINSRRLSRKKSSPYDVWNTRDWKFIDYSSSDCESTDDNYKGDQKLN